MPEGRRERPLPITTTWSARGPAGKVPWPAPALRAPSRPCLVNDLRVGPQAVRLQVGPGPSAKAPPRTSSRGDDPRTTLGRAARMAAADGGAHRPLARGLGGAELWAWTRPENQATRPQITRMAGRQGDHRQQAPENHHADRQHGPRPLGGVHLRHGQQRQAIADRNGRRAGDDSPARPGAAPPASASCRSECLPQLLPVTRAKINSNA